MLVDPKEDKGISTVVDDRPVTEVDARRLHVAVSRAFDALPIDAVGAWVDLQLEDELRRLALHRPRQPALRLHEVEHDMDFRPLATHLRLSRMEVGQPTVTVEDVNSPARER